MNTVLYSSNTQRSEKRSRRSNAEVKGQGVLFVFSFLRRSYPEVADVEVVTDLGTQSKVVT